MQIPITSQKFQLASSQLSKQLGHPVAYPDGTISHSGVDLSYSFDGSTLTVTVLKKPFFLSEGYIESQISSWFAGQ